MAGESSPLISMFPCFHIVYGWCKLLVCSLIALICSFHRASSYSGYTHWKEKHIVVCSCVLKGCSFDLHAPVTLFKLYIILSIFPLQRESDVLVLTYHKWSDVYFLTCWRGWWVRTQTKIETSFGKHTNVWYIITYGWTKVKWITLLEWFEWILWLFWLFFPNHETGSPLESIVTTVNPS